MDLITTIGTSTLIQGLPEIAANGIAGVSFWGSRYIEVPGFEGRADIDALAEKIIELTRINGFPLTQIDRYASAEIARHITRIYNESDDIVAKSNCFTRLCCVLRRFFIQSSIGYNGNVRTNTSWIRSIWHDDFDSGFNQNFTYSSKV